MADVKPTMITIEPYDDLLPRQTGNNVPAFLMKLLKLVEDDDLDSIISWSENGETFKVHDQAAFSKDVLPKYYKHNNFSSFVRQVNMYGFRKIVDPSSGSLKPDNNQWEFFHQNFQRGKPHLMSMIKRKATTKDHENKAAANQVTTLFSEVERLKQDHESVTSKLENVKKENEMLWREVGDLRDQHKSQQVVINQLIQVFVKILMTNKKDASRGVKRRALDYPDIETKVPRPSTQEVLPYSNNSQIFSHILPEETVYTVDSPSPIRLTELPEESITVLNEGISQHVEDLDVVGGISTRSEQTVQSPATTVATTTLRTKPFVIKNNEKTITIVPSSKPKQKQVSTTATNHKQTAPSNNDNKNNATMSTGFVFPEKYVERVAVAAADPSQLNFSVSNDDCCTDSNSCNATENALVVVHEPTNVLLTPNTTLPPSIVSNRLVSKSPPEPMTTPVVNLPPHISLLPNYARQDSFRDRKEISDNVEKINRSIEVIQDMLENQPVNLDLKSLNYTEGLLPDQVSVHELSRLLLNSENPEPSSSTGIEQTNYGTYIENEGQLIPYVEPLSPSQYMDPHFTTSSTNFLDDVLDGDGDNSNDDILVE